MAAATRSFDTSSDELIARARALAPMLVEHGAQADRERRLPERTVAALIDAGLLRLSVPRRFGGLEIDLPDEVEISRVIAQGCGSTSWVVALFYVTTWVAALFPDAALEEVFTSAETRVAGTLKPSGTLTPSGGGYIVNGQWPFNTGCLHATWDMVASLLPQPDGSLAPYAMLLPMKDLEIQDDWRTTGMRGTGSNSVVAREVFVPSSRVVPLVPLMAGEGPRNAVTDELLYRYPFMPFLMASSAGTLVGMAEAMMAAFLGRLPGRTAAFEFPAMAAARAPRIQAAVGEAQAKIDAALVMMRECCAQMNRFARDGLNLPSIERVRVRAHVGFITRLCREAGETLMSVAGANAHDDQTRIQRCFRDLETLCNHGVLEAGNNLELYGRMLVGQELGTAFV